MKQSNGKIIKIDICLNTHRERDLMILCTTNGCTICTYFIQQTVQMIKKKAD